MRPTWGDPGDGNAALADRHHLPLCYLRAALFGTAARSLRPREFHIVLADKLIYLVGELFTGRVSLKQVQGPLGIVQESSQAAKRGFGDLISLMALVSLNLGILNLLPIPILDGGHILMLAIEGLMRHDLSLKIKERVVTVGMVFLLLVFLIVMYNDVLAALPEPLIVWLPQINRVRLLNSACAEYGVASPRVNGSTLTPSRAACAPRLRTEAACGSRASGACCWKSWIRPNST